MGKKYLDIFCKQAVELVAALQSGLLVLEQHPGRASLVKELQRNIHTLKGSAGMVGVPEIAAIAQGMAEELTFFGENHPAAPGAISRLTAGAEAVAVITAALATQQGPAPDLERVLAAHPSREWAA